jgi:hypothetical protein
MSRLFSRVRLASLCVGAVLASLAIVACGETGAAPAAEAPAGDAQKVAAPQPLDIPTKSGTLTLMAPAGAKSKVGSSIDVTAGPGFQIEINAGIGVLSRFKQDVQSNTMNVFKRFVLDEPPLGMVYESSFGGKSEYHLLFIVKGVMRGLVCQDTKGPVYTEEQARAMYDSCKTLALKP